MKKFLLPTMGIIIQFAFCQVPKSPIHPYGEITPEEINLKACSFDTAASALILFDKGEFYLGNDLTATLKRHVRIKFFTKELIEDWASKTITLNKSNEIISKLKASTYNLENGKLVESKMDDNSIFKSKFDKTRNQLKFTLPNVREGSIIEYSYTQTFDFALLPSWPFQATIPNQWSQYITYIPSSVTFKKDMQGYLPITSHISEQEGSKETWIVANAPAFKIEPDMTIPEDYLSAIHFHLDQIFIPGRPLFKNEATWEKIGNEYATSSEFGLLVKGSGFLKNKVEELTAGLTSEEQKVKAIFDFVKSNLEWNNQKDKIPDNSLKKVLEAKKGSTSEINFLLMSMLEKANIETYPVLHSDRENGIIRPFSPSDFQFNDVIAVAVVNGKKILLDGTDPNLSMNSLPKRCLNGEGLIVNKTPEWIPLTSAKSKIGYSSDIKISENGEVSGNITISKDGQAGRDMRRSYKEKGEEKYVKEQFAEMSWEVSKSTFNQVMNTSEATKETHQITIPNHAQSAGNVIYINPILIGRVEENPYKSEQRLFPVDISPTIERIYLTKIQIPDGYMVEEIPKSKAVALPENGGKFLYNISVMGNTINFTCQYSLNRNLFSAVEYSLLREFYAQLVAKQTEQIVLKKK